MAVFLGLGECMVELMQVAPGQIKQGFAGDVLNTLWYARAHLPQEWNVQFHSAVGVDPLSEDMLRFIEGAGIDCTDMMRVNDRVPGSYTIILDGAERSFTYDRDMSAARLMLRDAEALWAKVAAADLVYLSGITLAILSQADRDTLISGVRGAMKDGAMLAFDPNIRPRLWSDEEVMRRDITRMAGVSDLVLPSFDDEKLIFGDESPEATLTRYLQAGAVQVLVKDGAGPVLVSDGTSTNHYPTPPVASLVDTTAAGDSFAGALLGILVQTGDMGQAIRGAQACAGKVIGERGALIPMDKFR